MVTILRESCSIPSTLLQVLRRIIRYFLEGWPDLAVSWMILYPSDSSSQVRAERRAHSESIVKSQVRAGGSEASLKMRAGTTNGRLEELHRKIRTRSQEDGETGAEQDEAAREDSGGERGA